MSVRKTFTALAADTERIKTDLRSMKYSVIIRGLAVTVRKYQDEIDYSAEIEQIFAKFRQGDGERLSYKIFRILRCRSCRGADRRIGG